MKKIFLVLGAASLVVFAACNKEHTQTQEQKTLSLEATVEQHVNPNATKTALSGLSVVWAEGDAIKVYNEDGSASTTLTTSDAGSFAHFKGDDLASGDPTIAIYPAAAATGSDGTNITFTLPATQTYAANSFDPVCNVAVGAVVPGGISFKNTCGLLKLQLQGVLKVGRIELTTKGSEKLYGTFTVNASAAEPSATYSTGGSTTLTLDCTKEAIGGVQLSRSTATSFYFVVPVGAFADGFDAVVYDVAGDAAKFQLTLSTASANTVKRRTVKAMPALKLSLVPSATYTEYDYIGSDSQAWIDTKVKGDSDDFKIDVIFSDESTAINRYIFGNWIGEEDNATRMMSWDSKLYYHGSINTKAGLGSSYNFTYTLSTVYTVYYDNTIGTINGVSVGRSSLSKGNANDAPICLFQRSAGNPYTDDMSRDAGVKIYYIRLDAGSGRQFYGIPCKRNSDSVAGMYDVYSETFFPKETACTSEFTTPATAYTATGTVVKK